MKAKRTRTRKAKVLPTAEQLWKEANLSIGEAMTVTRYTRPRVEKLCDDKEFSWFWEGKRRRIVTESIRDYWTRKTAESMAQAS